eukprot:Amastigsp_a676473_6.p6 type:complete len:118 gc:universal Amastigsp_a676473_6:632-985(+)
MRVFAHSCKAAGGCGRSRRTIGCGFFTPSRFCSDSGPPQMGFFRSTSLRRPPARCIERLATRTRSCVMCVELSMGQSVTTKALALYARSAAKVTRVSSVWGSRTCEEFVTFSDSKRP